MTAPRGDMTATQIAAENRRARTSAGRDLGVDEAVTGGPFDDRPIDPDIPAPRCPVCGVPLTEPPTTDDCPSPEDHAAPPAPTTTAVQAELAARLADATTPTPDRFAPADWPRVVDRIIVPARSVADADLSWFLIPIANVASIGVTARAVGIAPRSPGRWTAVWVGDDRDERDRVLAQLAHEIGMSR